MKVECVDQAKSKIHLFIRLCGDSRLVIIIMKMSAVVHLKFYAYHIFNKIIPFYS